MKRSDSRRVLRVRAKVMLSNEQDGERLGIVDKRSLATTWPTVLQNRSTTTILLR